MPTAENVAQLEQLLSAASALVETKKVVDRVEHEIRVFKARLLEKKGIPGADDERANREGGENGGGDGNGDDGDDPDADADGETDRAASLAPSARSSVRKGVSPIPTILCIKHRCQLCFF